MTMKVKNEIRIYAINDVDTVVGEKTTLVVENVWNKNQFVHLKIGDGAKVAVKAYDLLKAIKTQQTMNNSTMTLEEKHFHAIMEHRFADFPDLLEEASKDCAKITLQHCIDVLNDMANNTSCHADWALINMHLVRQQKQLSDLNK